MKILGMRNSVTKIKWIGLKSRLDTSEEIVSELKDVGQK